MSEGPGQAIGLAMDVRDDHQVGLGVSEVVERFGGLDVLVNNAGLGMRTVNPSSSPALIGVGLQARQNAGSRCLRRSRGRAGGD